MICQFCGYEFEDACGKYGCPNCLGEGLDEKKMKYRLQSFRRGTTMVPSSEGIGPRRREKMAQVRKTKKSHPFRVVSPTSFKSHQQIGRFKTKEEAQEKINQIQEHMPENPLVIEKD